jgi:hypothetical protein
MKTVQLGRSFNLSASRTPYIKFGIMVVRRMPPVLASRINPCKNVKFTL